MRDPAVAGGHDAIIIPDDTADRIIRGAEGKDIPEEYRGGIGAEGVENIKKFVRDGGTLITLNGAWEFAQRAFELPIQNSLADVPGKDFFCPGSTLRLKADNWHPIAFGMPADALGLFRGSPSLRVRATPEFSQVAVPVRYPEQNILQSGWLIGEKDLSGKPAVVEFAVGKGKVILLAFPVQHRAQMKGKEGEGDGRRETGRETRGRESGGSMFGKLENPLNNVSGGIRAADMSQLECSGCAWSRGSKSGCLDWASPKALCQHRGLALPLIICLGRNNTCRRNLPCSF